MLTHTDIQIARQGALTRAIEHAAAFADPEKSSPQEIMKLAELYTDYLLDPDRINKYVMLLGAVIDFPLPTPTPASPAAAAPTAVSPPSTPTATSQPPVAPRPVVPPHPATETQPPLDAPASVYASTKCPWHPDKTRTSKYHDASYICADRECKWQMRVFSNSDGSETTKWLASDESGWLLPEQFDALVGNPA